MTSVRHGFVLAVVLHVAGLSAAAPPTAFECRWADATITIDGKADEPIWQQAQLIDQFYLPWLKDRARPAKTATRTRLLWDREALYFFADMDDADLYADVKEHDGQLWDNDVFELFFKPADDRPAYYEFQVNAAGAVLDMLLPSRGAGGYRRFKDDGDFHIQARVVLRGTLNKWTDRDSGWSVEGRMPWKDFLRTGGRPEPDTRWKFALCRYDYSVDFDSPELSTCAPLATLNHANFHYHEDYATLRFVGPRKNGASAPLGLDTRVALTTSRVVGSPDPPPAFRASRVYPNLKVNFPIAVVREPDSDRLLYIAQPRSYGPTAIYRMKDDPAVDQAETLLNLDDTAYDIAFHPRFKDNGFVYVGSNGPQGSKPKKTRVTRYTMSRQAPYALDPKSALVIIDWPSDGHNGGALDFGKDGYLYVTSGDGTSDSDTNVMGQGLDHLLSKVLRIDVDHPAAGQAYSVPKDNPFVGMEGVRPETWAYGLRNPWRLTVDAETGHVWVGNNGQDLWEQAFLVKKGDNYGWSVMEGSHPFYLTRKPGPTPFVKPTVEHHHSEARSLTGGIVYHGSKYPELRGAYVYGDYSTGKIWGVRHDGTRILWHRELADTTLQISGFGTDASGEILIADHRGQDEGGFYTLQPTPVSDRPAAFPTRLSDSGLFQSVRGHVVEPALIPYSVNAQLWSDGAHKERWMALPGADTTIDINTNRGWNFPDGTVLVKSFALEMAEGDPATRRWIETRFLTKQEGEWAGYSYLYNDEQTEGTLVGKEGTDRSYTIRTAGGTRQQPWHFPSRAECMVCHSRAANYVLGLTTVQMNCEHDYGWPGRQMRTLECLGVLRVNWVDHFRASLRDDARKKGVPDREVNAYVQRQTATRDPVSFRPSRLLPKPPEEYPRLVDPYDAKADLAARARSYLHANCAHCHVEAGGGNALINLEFAASLEKMNVLDAKPVHHTFGLPDARIIAPGHPERSVLLHRVGHRDAGFMPPLATAAVDREAVELLRQWIRSLDAAGKGGGSD